MRAGQYRQFADVEHNVKTTMGDRGQIKPDWQTLYSSVPMSIENLSGRQLELARQLIPTATHKVQLRYLSGIAPMMRVAFNGRYFNIESVDEKDFRDRYLTLLCTEQEGGL
jgi:SPP1 family predicted phage head-tail adaptor